MSLCVAVFVSLCQTTLLLGLRSACDGAQCSIETYCCVVHVCICVCCVHNSADKLYDSTREFLPKVSI
jgi:hypothetical protein